MPPSLFFPLDQFQPSQILSQNSEWVYFTLLLSFFLSISGIVLKKHFGRPYVKPLIVTVGLMLTIGMFKFKHTLTAIFEGWGTVGAIVLVFMALVIPYGLCRGFGLPGGKAFYLTYILFYIISWIRFPEMYYMLGDQNFGIVNLGLLVLFIVAVIKIVKLSKPALRDVNSAINAPIKSEIEQEIVSETSEIGAIKDQIKLAKMELHSVNDIAECLAEIQAALEVEQNNLSQDRRQEMVRQFNGILDKQDFFKKGINAIRGTLQKLGVADVYQIKEKQQRLPKAKGKEREILVVEIRNEERKQKIEKELSNIEKRIDEYLSTFNGVIRLSAENITRSPYPYEAKPYIAKARVILKDIAGLVKDISRLENKLKDLSKFEATLLKKEKKAM